MKAVVGRHSDAVEMSGYNIGKDRYCFVEDPAEATCALYHPGGNADG